jgi:hypothetical protein
MTHPHQLHATAALWSLRAALRWLAEHQDAVLIRRPQLGHRTTRPRSLAELEQHDVLLRQERAERASGSLRGLKPSAGSAMPGGGPGLVDLDREVAEVLAYTVDTLAYVHRHHPLLALSRHWHQVLVDVFHVTRDPRWTYLAVALPAAAPGVAAALGEQLAALDGRIRSVCGIGPDHWPIPLAPPCPACGVRRLRAQHSAPDGSRWTVICAAGCRCKGAGCECGMEVPTAGAAHIWDDRSPIVRQLTAALGLAA